MLFDESLEYNIAYGALTDGLISYYSFDVDCLEDDQSTNDFSDNNGVSNVAGGKINNGCDFEESSSQYLDSTDLAATDIWDGDFTISLWAKFESDGTSGMNHAGYTIVAGDVIVIKDGLITSISTP